MIVKESSSFKDLDAQVILDDGIYKRVISDKYYSTYKSFISSGLYEHLVKESLIVPHTEDTLEGKLVLVPQKIFITYPWEWSFSQLKDAALATLKIQKIALLYDFSLKDANCYNIQFYKNKPLLIDTTSFEFYEEGKTWVAYKEFCENFIAPLSLMSYKDLSLNKLFLSNIRGIPIGLTSKLLPFRSYFNKNILFHIHLHNMFQNKYSQNDNNKITSFMLSKQNLLNIINNLEDAIKSFDLPYKVHTEWDDYYNNTNYSKESFKEKEQLITQFVNELNVKNICDFGCNTGYFSKIFAKLGYNLVSLDSDPLAIENLYLYIKQNNIDNIHSILFDIVNPSPDIGWANIERRNLTKRIENCDVILALALIHHLRITFNIPFELIAKYFSSIARYLVIEFINKDDSQLQKMLRNREDLLDDYTQEHFENSFKQYYACLHKAEITGTNRILYVLETK